jgi:hypothetical protein
LMMSRTFISQVEQGPVHVPQLHRRRAVMVINQCHFR